MSSVGTPPAPNLAASISIHARLQARRLVRSAKLNLAIAAALPLVAVVGIAANSEFDAVEALKSGYQLALFRLLAYLLPFLFASGTIAEEVEGRTFTYLASRPAGRVGLVLGKWLAAWGFSAGLLAGTAVLMHIVALAASPTQFVEQLSVLARTIAALTLLAGSYSALTMFFGALVPAAAGLAGGLYIAIVEFIMAIFPLGNLPLLTLNHHALRVSHINPDLDPAVAFPVSLGLLVVGTLGWLVLCLVAVVPREFREGSG
jgi:ABC-type transport system involved in multi-copper enzyme maturation permease subunit